MTVFDVRMKDGTPRNYVFKGRPAFPRVVDRTPSRLVVELNGNLYAAEGYGFPGDGMHRLIKQRRPKGTAPDKPARETAGMEIARMAMGLAKTCTVETMAEFLAAARQSRKAARVIFDRETFEL